MNELENLRKNKPKLISYNLTSADVDRIKSRLSFIEDIGDGGFSLCINFLCFFGFIYELGQGRGLSWLLPILVFITYRILVKSVKFLLTIFTSKNKKYQEYSIDTSNYSGEYMCVYNEIEAKKKLQEKLRQEKLRDLKRKTFQFWINLDPYKFEHEITTLFKKNGFIAKTTKGSGDGGIDIFLNKNNRKGIAQCKRQKTKVSPSVIRDIYGTMISGKFNFAYVICPAGFSNESVSLEKRKKIILIGLKRIMEMNNEEINDIKFLNIK